MTVKQREHTVEASQNSDSETENAVEASQSSDSETDRLLWRLLKAVTVKQTEHSEGFSKQ